ncbi:CDP-glycerol glycerophosphotransferase family protein [Lactococcus hircilactis]|uniref:CDP-glycerol glycerophosphotransferase family protein n=1 Tax=Lactococcus hircilactis TaxID=1494462 RepID=UPI003FA1B74F
MTHIHLIGYNIFGLGGTSRANINLLTELSARPDITLVYSNQLAFSRTQLSSLKRDNPALSEVTFQPLSALIEASRNERCRDIFLISRESLFALAELLRRTYPHAFILGEIHTWLANVDEDSAAFFPYFDRLRVATPTIKADFIRKFHFDRVFDLHVSTQHLSALTEIPAALTKNFTMSVRFDEQQKNISYALRLWDYLVHIEKREFKLYIRGSGAADTLYHTLVRYYGLEQHVFINAENPPAHSIYLSTSRFETFGYSLAEALAKGQLVVTTAGDDGVIKENFGEMDHLFWLSGKLTADAQILIRATKTLPHPAATARNRHKLLENVGQFYQGLAREIQTPVKFDRQLTHRLSAVRREQLRSALTNSETSNVFLTFRNIYTQLRRFPLVGKVIVKPRVRQLGVQLADFFTQVVPEGKLHDNWIFIESFHGSNFSGDPKYLALAIKAARPNARIFVSSVNALVDVEIWNAGFETLRIGSTRYLHVFHQCKTIIVNGNTLDKAEKIHGQTIVQTWHGFPLKKMVNDLENPRQRTQEAHAFSPRMKKWDRLITSSHYNTQLLRSAFHLSENTHLKILETGAPRNAYLLAHKNDDAERKRIYEKMLNRPYNPATKFILFCPTWRRDNRRTLTQLDLKALMALLPDDYALIVKLHPLETALRKYYAKLDPRIHCFFNESTDIQELMLLYDILISDYSSAMFDFAHLHRKIICLTEDQADYAQKIGFYFDAADVGLTSRTYTTSALAAEILSPICPVNFDKITSELLSNDNLKTPNTLIKEILP